MPLGFNTAPCPFCGTDAANWDTGPCDHLIADYGDGTDGDRGILCGAGGSRSGNKALECLEPLLQALVDFGNSVVAEGDVEEGLSDEDAKAIVRSLYGGSQAPMWIEPALEMLGYGELPNEKTVELIYAYAVPWSESLIETSSILGTMASTNVSFVWAKNPSDGALQIENGIAPVTADIRSATSRIARLDWRRSMPG